jgi:Protein of unknown function (DUF5672)
MKKMMFMKNNNFTKVIQVVLVLVVSYVIIQIGGEYSSSTSSLRPIQGQREQKVVACDDNDLNNTEHDSSTSTGTVPVPIRKWNKLAVLVEPFHKVPAIEATIRNALEKLPLDWQVVAFLPKDANDYMNQFCNSTNISTDIISQSCLLDRVRYESLPKSYRFWDTDIYNGNHWRNQLFRNPYWWESLNAEWVLMIQCDTIICRPGEPPLKFPYLGGPRHNDGKYLKDVSAKYRGHMNGGFSIRNVTWSIECLKNLPSSQQGAEDSTFESCHMRVPVNLQPTYKDAALFASDNGHTGCITKDYTILVFQECPYGLHKPWTRAEVSESELEDMYDSCPGSRNLASLNGAI